MNAPLKTHQHEKHMLAEIWLKNFDSGELKLATVVRQRQGTGVESKISFYTSVMKKTRELRVELKLKAEFFKKMPEFRVLWHE